jgi:hypothetical protein
VSVYTDTQPNTHTGKKTTTSICVSGMEYPGFDKPGVIMLLVTFSGALHCARYITHIMTPTRSVQFPPQCTGAETIAESH